MKKKIVIGILAIIAVIGGVFGYKRINDVQPIEEPFTSYDVEYYGCPNSNRIKKLNTDKRKKNRMESEKL